jgi:hypothetical protein
MLAMATIVSLWYTYADLDSVEDGMGRGAADLAGLMMMYRALIADETGRNT